MTAASSDTIPRETQAPSAQPAARPGTALVPAGDAMPLDAAVAAATASGEQQILASLREQYPGVVAVAPGVALVAAGLTSAKDPESAARQSIHRGTFPFPVTKVSGRNVVLLADIARALSAARLAP